MTQGKPQQVPVCNQNSPPKQRPKQPMLSQPVPQGSEVTQSGTQNALLSTWDTKRNQRKPPQLHSKSMPGRCY